MNSASYEPLYKYNSACPKKSICSCSDVTFLIPLGTPQCLLLWRLSSCLGKWVKFSPYNLVLTYHSTCSSHLTAYCLQLVYTQQPRSNSTNHPKPRDRTIAIGSCSWTKEDVLPPTQTCSWPDLFLLQGCIFRYGLSILSYLSGHLWLNPKLL